MNYLDLTHTLSEETPSWNGSCGFHLDNKASYEHDFCVQKLKMFTGIGTHIDVPLHRFPEGRCAASMQLSELIAPICMLDVSKKADANYKLSLEEVHAFEKTHGNPWKGAMVLIHTGWSRFWNDKKAYRNEQANGLMQFPSISEEVASYLLDQGIVGLGIDTLSPDAPSSDFPVHRILLGADKYILENVANANQLPPTGATAFALPIPMQGAAEAPIRLIALSPRGET